MKKNSFVFLLATVAILIAIATPLKISALNYTISFTGSGASTTVDNVIVQNLTKGTTVTVPTGNVLNLLDVTTSVDNISSTDAGIIIYPNPVTDKSTITFQAKETGLTQINIYCLDGRKIAGISKNLIQGNNSFQFSVPNGTYSIQVQGNGYAYTSKLISHSNTAYTPTISFTGGSSQNTNKPLKSKSEVTTMLYSSGDQLLYKGKSANYTTIVTDIPTSTKTTNFEFVECKDADGNNYAVVKIGTQTWMAENLKTTKFNDGTAISFIYDPSSWLNCWNTTQIPAYCYYNNDFSNKSLHGTLYNWYAVGTSKLAPAGWHVPTDNEWTVLDEYLINNGYNYDGTLVEDKISKSLAANTGWSTSTTLGLPGNELTLNNKSGFSAFASGSRSLNGTFQYLGSCVYYWTSSEDNSTEGNAWFRNIGLYNLGCYRSSYAKGCGNMIRCVKN